jgi:hypothetical protein
MPELPAVMRGGLRVPGRSTAKLAGAIENTIAIVGAARCNAGRVTISRLVAGQSRWGGALRLQDRDDDAG